MAEYFEGPGHREDDAYLYEPHHKECSCSMCAPGLHGPTPDYYTHYQFLGSATGDSGADYKVTEKKGWLFE